MKIKPYTLLTFGGAGLGSFEYQHKSTAYEHAAMIGAKAEEFVILIHPGLLAKQAAQQAKQAKQAAS